MRLRGQKIEDDEDIPEFLLDKRTAPSIQSNLRILFVMPVLLCN